MKTVLFIVGVTVGVLAGLYVLGRRAIDRVEPVDFASVIPATRGHFVQTRSGRVHYLDRGTGSPVLLIHGSGRSIADWQEGVVNRLSERHRVIAFDCYGFGLSERNPKFTYGYDLWIQQAVDLLDSLGVDKVAVVGHSVGGALACMLAASHPERVDHVVTIGTGMAIEPQQFIPVVPGLGEFIIARETMFGPAASPANRAALEETFRIKGTRRALLMYARRQMTIDGLRLLRGVFEDVSVPVLHVSGSEDRNISPSAARRLAKRTRGKFALVPGATHNVHTDAPTELVREIEQFIAQTQ